MSAVFAYACWGLLIALVVLAELSGRGRDVTAASLLPSDGRRPGRTVLCKRCRVRLWAGGPLLLCRECEESGR